MRGRSSLTGWASFLIAAGILLAGFGGPLVPWLDTAAHLRLHIAALLLIFSIIWLAMRARRRALLALGLASLGLATSVPWMDTGVAPAGDGPRDLRLLAYNMQATQTGLNAKLATILGSGADIVILPESTSTREFRARIAKTYPHALRCKTFGVCPVAMFSKYPLTDQRRIDAGLFPPIAVIARIEVDGQSVSVAGIHLSRPFAAASQRAEFAAIAEALATIEGPLVVAGDFNATPWSAALTGFATETGLFRAGDPTPTWPTWLGPFGLIIDHAFARGGATIAGFSVVGGVTASDHRPLLIDVVLQ